MLEENVAERPEATTELPVPEPGLTPEALVERARELRPLLRENQAATEERSYYSTEVHEAFRDAGIYRVLQPRRFGGYEFSIETFFRVVIEIARGCPSSGWCFGLGSGHVLQVASLFPEEAQREIFFPDGDLIACSRGTPTGSAVPTENGWLVEGQWDYCSGSPYATHALMTVTLPTPEGEPTRLGLAAIPREHWHMLDDWRGMLGMRGSGSHSIVAGPAEIHPSLVIPVHLGAVRVEQTQGYQIHGNPMYAGPVFTFLSGELTAVGIGTARGALDEETTIFRTKKTANPPRVLKAEDPDLQLAFGEALGLIDSAESVLRQAAQWYTESARRGAEGGPRFSSAQDARIRTTLVHANRLFIQGMDTIVRTGGSSSIKDGTMLQRYWRDMTVLRSHVTNTAWEKHSRQNGAAYLNPDSWEAEWI